jgi:DNA-binding transcriptional LysR family regulator
MNSIEAIKQCVIRGVGITIIPEISIREEARQGKLAILPWTEDQLETAVLMIWHKDKWLSPTLQAFMRCARSTVHALLTGNLEQSDSPTLTNPRE